VDATTLNQLSPFVIAAAWLVVLVAETVSPLRQRTHGERAKHIGRNLLVVVLGFAVNFFHGPMLAFTGSWARDHGVGLLAMLQLPLWADVLAGVVLLDVVDYWRHRVHHSFPLFWRLHRVHHLDESVDSSTGLLNHPFEVFSSLIIVAPAMVLLGVTPLALATRILVGMGLIVFHHSNLALPPKLDAALSLVTPTPRTHRVHHARRPPLTDSNYGTCFTWWDRLFGTWRELAEVEKLDTGLDEYPRQSAVAMLLHPFRRSA
jgi:sterol desaturase/sphingolipid hydroxylase (fatty acid hydroxylase superfamily)